MRTRTYRFVVRGETWKFIMMTARMYKKNNPELTRDHPAVTVPDKREVHFLAKEMTKRVVFHELLHVYTTYMYTDSADLSFANGEEMFADFFGDCIDEYYKTGNKIYKKLKPSRRGQALLLKA